MLRVTCHASQVTCHMSHVTFFIFIFFTGGHIVQCGKFHRIGGAPPETFPNVKYDAPEEMGGDRKCFDSPIRI